MSGTLWKIQPVYATIIEILEGKGSLNDADLLDALRAFYKDMNSDYLDKTLMKMEVTGLIHVSSLMKGKRLVQLVQSRRARNTSRFS